MTLRASPPSGKGALTRGRCELPAAGTSVVGGRAHHVFGLRTPGVLPANAHAV